MVSTRSSTKQISNATNNTNIPFVPTNQIITRSKNNTQFVELQPTTRAKRTKPTKPTHAVESTTTLTPEITDCEEDDSNSVVTEISTIGTSQYETNIDFDEAHYEWMLNKRRNANGTFVYICGYVKPNHKLCQKDCCDEIGIYSGCKKHYMWEEKQHKGVEDAVDINYF